MKIRNVPMIELLCYYTECVDNSSKTNSDRESSILSGGRRELAPGRKEGANQGARYLLLSRSLTTKKRLNIARKPLAR